MSEESKIKVWVGRDIEGLCAFPDTPTYRGRRLPLFLSGESNQSIDLPDWIAPLELELGECAEYEIIFRKVESEQN